jgi:hypothetical protein
VSSSSLILQQLLLSRIEDTLKPYGLTFAAYEALRLLAFTLPTTARAGQASV